MTDGDTIQVLAIDSDAGRRGELRDFLAANSGLCLSDEAADGTQALKILNKKRIDVVLVNLAAQADDAIELATQFKQLNPTIRVVVVTASDTPEAIFAAMDAGADGYLLSGPLSKDLVMAISSVRLGTVWLDPRIARQVLEVMATSALTDKTRTLPTGLLPMPLMPDERDLLHQVAGSNCVDGVCMIDPSFMKKLKRYAPRPAEESA